jgi:prepilin signal peptidase PulO-like enzyme (type II secretory pathway)
MMMMKIGDIARTLYIVLALVAGFVALGRVDVALVLVVLGLISGISMPDDRNVIAAVLVVALPAIGTALTHIPAIGAQLNAVALNLQAAMAGAVATAVAIRLAKLAMDGVTGLTASGAGAKPAAAAAR